MFCNVVLYMLTPLILHNGWSGFNPRHTDLRIYWKLHCCVPVCSLGQLVVTICDSVSLSNQTHHQLMMTSRSTVAQWPLFVFLSGLNPSGKFDVSIWLVQTPRSNEGLTDSFRLFVLYWGVEWREMHVVSWWQISWNSLNLHTSGVNFLTDPTVGWKNEMCRLPCFATQMIPDNDLSCKTTYF